ncbi:MAG: lipoprotein [Candidatus Omnitrophica bacterium]|nr:lipoprotein [Candidatus Omnitrophota bacterium]
MRKLFIIFLITFFLAGCNLFWQKYSNEEYKFSLLLPNSWSKEGMDKVALIAKAPLEGKGDVYPENINVVVTELPEQVSLGTFYELNREELLRNLPGAYDQQEGSAFAGFLPGKKFSFVTKIKEFTLRMTSVVFRKGKYFYVLTYAYEVGKDKKYEPIFNKIITSFRAK